jgi:tryptophan-rich sensory protein
MQNLHWSDAAFAIGPLILGIGASRLLTPSVYKKCGLVSKLQPRSVYFAIAWTSLYVLYGFACFFAWRQSGRMWTPGIILLLVTLVALFTWGVVFMNICVPAFAFAAICAILGLVIGTIAVLGTEGHFLSMILLLPLMLWMCFASYLSFSTF